MCPGHWVGASAQGKGVADSGPQGDVASSSGGGAGRGKGGGTKGKGKSADGNKGRLAELREMLVDRQKGLKSEQAAFTDGWVKALLATKKPNGEPPSLEDLTMASDKHVFGHMKEKDDGWLKGWKDAFAAVIVQPGDEDGLAAIESEVGTGECQNEAQNGEVGTRDTGGVDNGGEGSA